MVYTIFFSSSSYTGNFGTVSVVHRLSDSHPYVLKRIHIRSLSQDQRQAAMHESSLLSTLRHICIVGYIDSFLDGDDMCIVMEYCDGGDMGQVSTRGSEKKQVTDDMRFIMPRWRGRCI